MNPSLRCLLLFAPFFLLFSTALSADSVKSAEGEAILVQYVDETISGADMMKELDTVQKMLGTEHEPDRKTIFILADRLMLRKVMAGQATAKQLISDQDMADRLQRQKEIWLANAFKETLLEAISDEEMETIAREMYLSNRNEFGTPAQIKVSHILVSDKERSDGEAKTLAEEIRNKIVADPAQFEALAKEYSDDKRTGANGGALDWAPRTKYLPAFADAAFALKSKGEISPLVRTKYGYHVIRLDDIKPGEVPPFEEVKPKVIKKAEGLMRKNVLDLYMTKIKSSKDYRYDEVAVDKFFSDHYDHVQSGSVVVDEKPKQRAPVSPTEPGSAINMEGKIPGYKPGS